MKTLAAAPRLIASMPLALFVTAAIGALMQALVSQQPSEIVEVFDLERPKSRPLAIDPQPPEPTPREDRKPEPPPFTATTLPTTITDVIPVDPRGDVPDGAWLPFGPGSLGPTMGSQEASLVLQVAQLLFTPIVDYPQVMYPREGSCEVRFDITAMGATTNIQAASCTDQGFTRSAERTVSRAVYRPAQGEAGPVESIGHVLVIDFKIEE